MELHTLLAGLAAELLVDEDDRLAADALAAAVAPGGAIGMEAALKLARLIGEAGVPADVLATLARTETEGADAATIAVRLVMSCFAAARADYPSRPDATAARASLSGLADAAYPVVGTAGADVLDWLVRLVGATVRYLSAVAATRVPMVRVETGISLPSTLAAWELYGDPNRAAEIVQRNRIATPLVMPVVFEAAAG